MKEKSLLARKLKKNQLLRKCNEKVYLHGPTTSIAGREGEDSVKENTTISQVHSKYLYHSHKMNDASSSIILSYMDKALDCIQCISISTLRLVTY